ncbi:MAG: AbrB/MazE/SpoVT family DNA-binding domain-containing protein [Desulfobacca sp.]|uniref:AbrB/MazE/SpoVT family DNA-binding domain-containing protein n=1 Tax=Desulfobacca sp. TaxID=2067990 RepID=UPI004049A4A4
MTVVKVLRHGQITLPKNLREELDIKEGDILEIAREQSCLVLKAKMLVDKDRLPDQDGQERVLPVLPAGGLPGLPRLGAAAEQGEGAP